MAADRLYAGEQEKVVQGAVQNDAKAGATGMVGMFAFMSVAFLFAGVAVTAWKRQSRQTRRVQFGELASDLEDPLE